LIHAHYCGFLVLTLFPQDGLVTPHEVTSVTSFHFYRLVSPPVISAQMVRREQGREEIMTWVIRAVSLVLCWVSFSLLLHPVCIILKVIPALYHLCGM
jgi:hypothetical protein